MNVNLNANGIGVGNFGIGHGMEPTPVEGKGGNVSGLPNSGFGQETIQSAELDPLRGSEPVTEVPDAELRRDDALGRLVSSVFNLPPPPMPEFHG